ncbi:MAG: hypothetical protein ABSG43_13455 [Solirubrobacteraceae bacterium]
MLVFLGGFAPVAAGLAQPLVRPAAVLLSAPSQVVCGIYVGQTSDRLYIGEAVPEGGSGVGNHSEGYVIDVARSRVVRLIVGSTQPLDQALNRIRTLPKMNVYPSALAASPLPSSQLGCSQPTTSG